MNLRVFYLTRRGISDGYKACLEQLKKINGHHVNLHYNDGRLK